MERIGRPVSMKMVGCGTRFTENVGEIQPMKIVQEPIVGPRRVRHYSTRPHRTEPLRSASVCSQCLCTYENHRWRFDPARAAVLMSDAATPHVVCPACYMQAEELIGGLVVLDRRLTDSQRVEVTNQVRRRELRLKEKNPMHRVVYMDSTDDGLRIGTTTVSLTRNLARHIAKSLHGTMRIHQLPEEEFVQIEVVL